jgi:hypothetical protein
LGKCSQSTAKADINTDIDMPMFVAISKDTTRSLSTFFFILLVFLSPVIRFATGFFPYLLAFVLMVGWGVILLLRNYYLGYKALIPIMLLLSMTLFVVMTDPSNLEALFYSFVSLISFMTAFWLAKQDIIKVSKISLIALLLFYMFFIYSMIKHGSTSSDVNNYFIESSRNAVSATALFLQILHSTAYYRANKRLPKITPAITFLIAILAYGRSGVALSAGLVVFTFAVTFLKTKPIYKLAFSFVILIFFLLLSENITLAENIIFNKTNFSSGLESPRTLMVQQYWESMDLISFLVGSDLSTVPIISQYNNNPHNSIIYGHSQYGIFYIILMSWFFFVVCWYGIFYKKTAIYITLISIYLVRIFLDSLSLPGVFDFIFYYIFFVLCFDCKYHRLNRSVKNSVSSG